MAMLRAIVAVSENGVMGTASGKLPWHLPEDFRWFKHQTLGGTLVMGRKTHESIGRPLPGRKTIVLTHNPTPIPGVEICNDIEALPDTSLWICGGAQIYEQLLPMCALLYLTRVKGDWPGDIFFPPVPAAFECDQVIYETAEFRVERWKNTAVIATAPPPEKWPFD